MAGVLSIETEKPHFDEGLVLLWLGISSGSFGYVTPTVLVAKIGNRTRLALNANYMRADGKLSFTLVNGKYVTEESVIIQIFILGKEKQRYIILLKMVVRWT